MTATITPAGIFVFVLAGAGPLMGLLSGGAPSWMLPGAVIAAMLVLVGQVAIGDGAGRFKGLPLAVAGAVYVGVLFPFFALLRNSPHGIPLVMLMLLVVIVSDSGAYFGGSAFGRIKLAPAVSPKKTVEGAVAGLVLAIAAGVILRGWLVPDWTVLGTAVVSGAIAILSQLGDLAGSALKRSAGVKDSGWIFPGHGGLLDRACSLVFAVVFTYYYSR